MNPVPVSVFNQVCVQCGVILTTNEVAKLSIDCMINYKELSKEVSNFSMERVGGLNPLSSIDRVDLEKVFRQNTEKKFVISKKRRVLYLCQLNDKSNSGVIEASEFKKICLSCNFKPLKNTVAT